MNAKPYNILFHVIGWAAFILFPVLFLVHPQEYERMHHLWIFVMGIIISNLILILFFYANYYFLVPRFYVHRQYVFYLLICGAVLFFFVLIMVSNPMFAPPPNTPPIRPGMEMVPTVTEPSALQNPAGLPPGFRPPPLPEHIGMWPFALANIFKFLVVFFLSLGLRINLQLRKTEEEKTKTNLNYLKAQVNPHFLFNTLNGIYSLAVQKSDLTPDAIAKLSAIMRYVTTEVNADEVLLQKEVDYIHNYIDLQKMRLTSNVKVDFTIKGSLAQYRIAPLIMIPFIENCFKYGVSTEKESYINIMISMEGKLFSFHAENKIVRDAPDHEKSGIGIANVKHRMELIYPDQHILDIEQKNDIFTINLTITLH